MTLGSNIWIKGIKTMAQYDSYDTVDALLFPEAEYICEPEQRAFYSSYVPQYSMTWRKYTLPTVIDWGHYITEFSPKIDCLPMGLIWWLLIR